VQLGGTQCHPAAVGGGTCPGTDPGGVDRRGGGRAPPGRCAAWLAGRALGCRVDHPLGWGGCGGAHFFVYDLRTVLLAVPQTPPDGGGNRPLTVTPRSSRHPRMGWPRAGP